MKNRMGITYMVLGALAMFAVTSPLWAQQTQSQPAPQTQSQSQAQTNPKPPQANPGQQPSGAPTTATPAPTTDPKEDAAFKAFADMKPASDADREKQIKAGEDFLTTYPQSRYRVGVYSRLTNAYFANREMDKMYGAADAALAIDPDDLAVLTLVGWVIPHGDPNAADFKDKLDKAAQYEKHALELLPNLPKPAALTDEQFAEQKNDAISQAHSGLGLVYFREGKFEDSAAELQKATGVVKDSDATDYLVLGVDLMNLQKFSDAEKAFDSCTQIPSSVQANCKQRAADAKAKAANQLQPPKP